MCSLSWTLGARLGFGRTAPTARHAIVVVQFGDNALGLLVDGVNEIVSALAIDIRPVPDVARRSVPRKWPGILPYGDRMIF